MLGTVLHSALLVPYASWRSSHAGHHRHTCSVEHDEAFAPRVLAPGAEVRPLTWPCAPCLRVVASASALVGGWWSVRMQCAACLVLACACAMDLARTLSRVVCRICRSCVPGAASGKCVPTWLNGGVEWCAHAEPRRPLQRARCGRRCSCSISSFSDGARAASRRARVLCTLLRMRLRRAGHAACVLGARARDGLSFHLMCPCVAPIYSHDLLTHDAALALRPARHAAGPGI